MNQVGKRSVLAIASLLLSPFAMLCACTTSDAGGANAPSSAADAQHTDTPVDSGRAEELLDAGPSRPADAGSTPDAGALPNDPVALPNLVVPREDRVAFCTEVANCKTGRDYQDCLQFSATSAAVDFARPGCGSTNLLIAAMGCQRAVDLCGSSACDDAIDAWWTRAHTVLEAGGTCKIGSGELGIGDTFAPIGFGDSMCQGIKAGGGWCTGACASDAACEGTHAGGKNVFGRANLCAADTLIGGKGCYPTCSSTRQCVDWYGIDDAGRLRNTTCRKLPELASAICVQSTQIGTELP